MRVALVLPSNANRRSSAISQAGAEHLGLGYLAAYLRSKGQEVKIYNSQTEDYISSWEGLKPISMGSDQFVARIVDFKPDLIGVSVTGVTIKEAIEISKGVKSEMPNCHVCWGGHQAYHSAKAILEGESVVDTIIAGDGEESLSKLLAELPNTSGFKNIPGLWYRNNGDVLLSSLPAEPDLDTLPNPARDTIEELVARGAKMSDARISTSRGCQFKCSFCVDPALGYRVKWRARSAKHVVDEIENLVKRFGVNFLWFSEDNFIPPTPAGRKRAKEISRLLIEKNLKVNYRALLRADALDGQELMLDNLIKSGLACVYIGIESGSPRRLGYFNKLETPDLYRRVISMLRHKNVGLQIGFIMFDPLTTWEDIDLDIEFLHEIGEMYLYSNFSQILDLFPGTEMSRILIQKGLLDPNFTYNSAFDQYEYENADIGRFAHIIQTSYTSGFIELDKFFQRLRVVDRPQLIRDFGEKDKEVKITLDIFDRLFRKLNDEGLRYFKRNVEFANSDQYEKISSSTENHYHKLKELKDGVVNELCKREGKCLKYISAIGG